MSVASRTAIALVVSAACSGGSGGQGGRPVTAGRDAAAQSASPQGATMPEVTIKSAGERPGRPPMIRLLVDVTIANPAAEARWVLIPTKLPVESGGVDKLEQLTAGAIKLGRFLGTGGCYAISLAPGARVTLKNLELGWWNDKNASSPPAIDVRTAADFTLGDAPIASWFDGDPAVGGTVEGDLDAAKHTRSHRAPGDREVAIAASGEQKSTIAIAPR